MASRVQSHAEVARSCDSYPLSLISAHWPLRSRRRSNGSGLHTQCAAARWNNHDAGMVAYFDFFGTRFFGPDLPDGSASSPWHGQPSLKASKARVMPGSLNRSGFWSRYRNRTLALSKMLPWTGGHARTSGGRFRAKNMAVSIIPSHAPADRAAPLSWNEPSTSSSQYLCASAPVSTTVPLAFPMTKSAKLATMT